MQSSEWLAWAEKGPGQRKPLTAENAENIRRGCGGKALTAMGVKVTLKTQRKAVKVSCDA